MPHTYCIDVVSVGSDPQATSAMPHRGDHGPLVVVRVVALSCVEDATPVDTPANVDLKTGLAQLHLIWIPLQIHTF